MPAEIGQLTSLEELASTTTADESAGGDRAAHLAEGVGPRRNQLTSVPAEIGQLTSLTVLDLDGNQLTSVPAEIWQLTSLRVLYLTDNKLTSVPAEIGQLTSLTRLYLSANQLTSVPAEIGQLTSLRSCTSRQQADESARCDTRAQSGRLLRAAGCRRDTFVACNTTFTAFTAKHSSKKTFTNNNGRVDTYPTVSPHGEPASRPR